MRWAGSVVFACTVGTFLFQTGRADDSAGRFPLTADSVLSDWETASAGLLGVGPLENRRLYHFYQAAHSAHEIALLNEFRGPVSAADLKQRFTWSLETRGRAIVLTGSPADDLEKLFFEKVCVIIDPETHLPKTLRFHGTNPAHQAEDLAVVISPRLKEPNRFWPDETARPLKVASREHTADSLKNVVRVVEHVTLLPVPERPLPPQVQQVLEAWEQSAGRVQALEAEVTRRVYSAGSNVEERSAGDFTYSASPLIECTLKPLPLEATESSDRVNSAGVPYELLPSPAEHWEYTATEIRVSATPGEPAFVLRQDGNEDRPAQRKDSEESNPSRPKKPNVIIAPWRMLFQVSAKRLAERFEIRRNGDPHSPSLEFFPKQPDDIGGFRAMRIDLNPHHWLPETVQFLNDRGDREVVYRFRYTEIVKRQPLHREPRLLRVKTEVPRLQPAPTHLHGPPQREIH